MVPFERMDYPQLIEGFISHFLVSVVELTPFLSISVCWFWFWDKGVEPRRDRVAVCKGGRTESYR